MNRLDELISSKLASAELTAERKRDISDTQLSKIQNTILAYDNHVFKKKSCVDQFKFNVKVTTKLREAESNIEGGKNVGQAAKDIAEGIALMNNTGRNS